MQTSPQQLVQLSLFGPIRWTFTAHRVTATFSSGSTIDIYKCASPQLVEMCKRQLRVRGHVKF